MFVGDQDGGEVFRHAAEAGEALANLQRGKPGIHEDAGRRRFQIGTVAAGAAAENGELDGHKRTLAAGNLAGNSFLCRRAQFLRPA